jgi:futalosine hydrolase
VKILILSATTAELGHMTKQIDMDVTVPGRLMHFRLDKVETDVLISGIGIAATTFWLTKALYNDTYDVVINQGIAGSYNGHFKIGDVLQVESEVFGDLGIGNEQGFSTLFEKEFLDPDSYPFDAGWMYNLSAPSLPSIQSTPSGRGITVHKSTGDERTMSLLLDKYNGDLETMEGAAFFYVCKMMGVPCFLQLRSISNPVKAKSRAEWDIPLAVREVNEKVLEVIGELDGALG